MAITEYNITVWTGNVAYADTHAKVYARLCGTRGQTAEYELEGEFKSGKEDHMTVRDPVHVGTIKYLAIQHDNTGTGPGWFLDRVAVEVDKKLYDFRAYRWLAKDEADQQTRVVLAPFDACKC